MIFPLHKKKKQNKAVRAISIFALLVLIFILIKSGIAGGPVAFAVSKFALPRAVRGEANVREALLLESRLLALERENKDLKTALGEKIKIEIPSKIKLGGGYLFSDILLLDDGVDAGLEAGDIVLAPGKIFVGKISETGANWSKVEPVGRLGGKIALRAGKDKEITFEALGAGRGELLAQFPKDTPVVLGDIVWLGEDPEYSVGLVSGIRKSEGREIQDVRIISPLPLGSLAEVAVLKNR